MTAHRAKYERMSGLSRLEGLPELTVDDKGLHFELRLDGHHVVFLRLQ